MDKYVKQRLNRQINENCDFDLLSSHPDLTLETLKEYPDKPWDFDVIVHRDNFDISWLKALPDANWDWSYMHRAKKFRMYWLGVFYDKPWDSVSISSRATIHDLRLFPFFPWDWMAVTCYSPITPEEMIYNDDLPWDFDNFGFTKIEDKEIRFIRYFNHKFNYANWVDFTIHTPWSTVKKNFDLPWVIYYIQVTPEEFIERDLRFIRGRELIAFNWEHLSRNIHLDIIINNLDLPWLGQCVSENPTLEYRHLSAPLEWNYSITPCEPIEVSVLRWHSANVIKWAWKRCICDPSYNMCRKRLEKELKELIDN